MVQLKAHASRLFDDLSPGQHVAVFETPINIHRSAVAFEDAGFEIRDQLVWICEKVSVPSWFSSSPRFLQGAVCILLARKPLERTVVDNVLKYGTGALNIGACRIPHADPEIVRKNFDSPVGMEHCARDRTGERGAGPNPKGRFPANVLHDGSPSVVKPFPDSNGAGGSMPLAKVTGYGTNIGEGTYEYNNTERIAFDSGTGSSSRFFKNCRSLPDVLSYIQTLINGETEVQEDEN